MAFLKPKTFSEKELAQNFLNYVNDLDGMTAKYREILKGLTIGNLIFSLLMFLILFIFPSELKYEYLPLVLFLTFMYGVMLTIRTSVKNTLNTMTNASKYFDKQKLENTVNSSNA